MSLLWALSALWETLSGVSHLSYLSSTLLPSSTMVSISLLALPAMDYMVWK
jgi:hypothetical protein